MKRVWIVLLASAFACLQATQGTAKTSSTQLVNKDPYGQYQVIKQAYSASAPKRASISPAQSVNASDCGDTTDPIKDKLSTWLVFLAVEVVSVERTFRAAGYPQSVWQPLLNEFEQQQLRHIVKYKKWNSNLTVKYASRVTQAAAKHRKASHTSRAKVIWEVACGGGAGIELKVITKPKSGVVMLRPDLYHVVCTAQGVDTKKFSECDQYYQVNDGEVGEFSGVYWYSVKWPDGRAEPPIRKDFTRHRGSAKEWVITRSSGT